MADTSHLLNERRDVFPDKSQIGQRVLVILHGTGTWIVSVVVKFSYLGTEWGTPQIRDCYCWDHHQSSSLSLVEVRRGFALIGWILIIVLCHKDTAQVKVPSSGRVSWDLEVMSIDHMTPPNDTMCWWPTRGFGPNCPLSGAFLALGALTCSLWCNIMISTNQSTVSRELDQWEWSRLISVCSAELCLGGDSQLCVAGSEELGCVDLHLSSQSTTSLHTRDQESGQWALGSEWKRG